MPQSRRYASNAKRQAAYRARAAAQRTQEQRQKGLPALPAIPTLPGHARWKKAMQTAWMLMDEVCSEMHDYFDDRSEEWQESERAEEFNDRMEAIEEARDGLEELLNA